MGSGWILGNSKDGATGIVLSSLVPPSAQVRKLRLHEVEPLAQVTQL